jgi:hypothetical protein
MEYIYVITGFLTIAFAIAGLVPVIAPERGWPIDLRVAPAPTPARRT